MIDEATITAIVVGAQRKTKCFMPIMSPLVTGSRTEGEKALANEWMNDKRVGVI